MTYETELEQDARHYSDLCNEATSEAEREFVEVHLPIADVLKAIRDLKGMTDAQLKQIISTLACKAVASKCHPMIAAALDDAGELL